MSVLPNLFVSAKSDAANSTVQFCPRNEQFDYCDEFLKLVQNLVRLQRSPQAFALLERNKCLVFGCVENDSTNDNLGTTHY
jgi:hypothetical protein